MADSERAVATLPGRTRGAFVMRGVVIALVAVLVLAAVVVVVWSVRRPAVARVVEPEVVAEEPCPESEFTCVTLRVPRDYVDGSDRETMEVTFAVLRASGERQGVFVTATGGPGSSGIAVADSYTSAFDPDITERYDVVFFDQRGIGLSEPIQCADAALEYYSFATVPTSSDDATEAFADAAAAFSAACVAEMEVEPESLDSYATLQAIEDLDVFRRWLGVEQLHLYGESYGTQFVQTYASVHPDAVAALIVDGPVDLTLSGTDYWIEGARAFEAALIHALESCTDLCSLDEPAGGLLAAWDALVDELGAGPKPYELTLPDGTRETRELTLGDLETAAAGYVYSTFDQMLLQRAVAYAARGDLAPMARLTLVSLGQDPETLEPVEDPTWSDALYYAVECMDYAYGSGSTEERERAFLDAGEAASIDEARLGSAFYGDLPCASWPVHAPSEERPGYLVTDAYPILVLASTTDPATPYAGARRLYEHAGDGYLVTQPGGPHVIFGRGNACPDDLVTAFLLDGELPSERETRCEPMTPDPFAPLAPLAAFAGDDPSTDLLAVDDEIVYAPEFWVWPETEDLTIGCSHGGTVTYSSTETGYAIGLDACEFVGSLPVSGDGSFELGGGFSMTITAPGGTDVVYERDADYNVTVTGTWFGLDVDVEG